VTRNTRVTMVPILVVVLMTGLAWASVPLYRLFCQATGLNGTTNVGLQAPGGTHHSIVVSFDTNVSPGMPWKFRPENPSDTVDIGARDMAFFLATNTSDHPITGTATYNVTPAEVGKYFTKIQCFCFTQQTLQPGETARMPVIFYVDPKILSDPDANEVTKITLSYTFWPTDAPGRPGRTAHDG
jgi:cytochrome c oxidase assembly protein subunit 11